MKFSHVCYTSVADQFRPKCAGGCQISVLKLSEGSGTHFEKKRREVRMPFGAIVSAQRCSPRGDPRCKKLPEFVGVARSGRAAGRVVVRPTNRAAAAAGKVCPMELENWVQTSHSKPGSKGHRRVASNSGRRVDRWSLLQQPNSWSLVLTMQDFLYWYPLPF